MNPPLTLGILVLLVACATTAPEPSPVPPPPETERCPLHDEPLLDDEVPIVYGLVLESEPWAERAPYAFPHVHGGCVVGGKKTTCVKYCPKCRQAIGLTRAPR